MATKAISAFAITHTSGEPIGRQIYRAMRQGVIEGHWSPGERLPASRTLALELGVSRATVVDVYDQLIAEGFAHGRRGSGIYVSNIGQVEFAEPPPPIPPRPHLDGRPQHPKAFQPGRPDMRIFPYRQWGQCIARIARGQPEMLIGSGSPFGDERLRTAIAGHLGEWRGLTVSPHQIIITAGAGDALEICLRTLAVRGDAIGFEDPGYQPIQAFVESLGMRPVRMRVGAMGAQPPSARRNSAAAKLITLTPSHQFPLGGAMPASRRIDFLNWAEANDSWIIEDDYDSEFRYGGRPIPALTSFDKGERSIYVGSFSKIFADGLRLGFLVAPPGLTDRFDETLRQFGTKASHFPQRALASFIETGEFHKHLRRMRRIYGERRRVLVDLLHDHLAGQVTFEDHQAGMQIALHLPAHLKDTAVSAAAARHDIICPALSAYCSSRPAVNGLLMGFAAFAPEEMTAPIKTLAEVLQTLRG